MNKYYVYLLTKQIIVLYATSYSRTSSEIIFYDANDSSFAFFNRKCVLGVEKEIKEKKTND